MIITVKSRMHVFRLLTLCLSIVCLSLSANMAYAEDNSAELSLTKCKREKGSPYTFGSECGTLTLRENPADSNSRKIDVHVMRIPSIRKSEKTPIFFIAGGPGQASTSLAPMMRTNLSSLLTEHDFVFVDQRGTGKSHPLNCKINDMEYVNLNPSDFQPKHKSLLQECVNELDADFQFYTTPYAVMDLEKVRKALGYKAIHLWGGSYGTRVVLEYQRSFPASIDRAVLDGVAPISIELPRHANNDASGALEKIFAACHEDDVCRKNFGDLKTRWLELLSQLREKPVSVEMRHPRTQEKIDVFLSDRTLSAQVRLSLYSREASTLLPLAIDKALKGDYSVISSFVFIGYESMADSISTILHLAVLCNEDRLFAEYGKQNMTMKTKIHAPLITGVDSEEFFALCSIFPEYSINTDAFASLTSDVPSLLLSGEFDPVTPPEWGEFTAGKITNSQHITVPGGHHIVTSHGCIADLITQFFELEPLPLNTECVENIKAKPFFIDNAGPAVQKQKEQQLTEEDAQS